MGGALIFLYTYVYVANYCLYNEYVYGEQLL